MLDDSFHVFDTTLRDGAQREGITYSVADKLAVARLLDELGVGFIEGGWPGAMPKDTEFFARARDGELDAQARACWSRSAPPARPACGSRTTRRCARCWTRRRPVVCLVAKSDVRHVERGAAHHARRRTSRWCATPSAFLRAEGRRVFVDCEHFFDGYQHDPDYGVRVLDAAVDAGADVGVLCDTNGGMLPMGVHGRRRRRDAVATGIRLGIHAQDDTGCAVANTLAAVEAGATHVQGTANGYGERAGNANIFAVIGGLALKMGLRRAARGLPGRDGAGLARHRRDRQPRARHPPALRRRRRPSPTRRACTPARSRSTRSCTTTSTRRWSATTMRILVTEMAGRASVELKGRELGVDLAARPDAVGRVVERVKEREAEGWSFEAADASFELLRARPSWASR